MELINVKIAMIESHLTGYLSYLLRDLIFYYGIISSNGHVIEENVNNYN